MAAAAASPSAAAAEGSGGDADADAADEAPLPPAVLALVNRRDLEGETALHMAARGNHLAAVNLLLAWGADPLVAANDGALAVGESDADDVIEALMAAMEAAEGEEEEGGADRGEGQ